MRSGMVEVNRLGRIDSLSLLVLRHLPRGGLRLDMVRVRQRVTDRELEITR